MSAKQRRKGAIGQGIAANLLRGRDWIVDQLTSGVSSGDLIGTSPNGITYLIEIKNCAGILPRHKKQAMEQAAKRRLPWLLMSHISGTSSWLIQRQGERPVIWHNGADE